MVLEMIQVVPKDWMFSESKITMFVYKEVYKEYGSGGCGGRYGMEKGTDDVI